MRLEGQLTRAQNVALPVGAAIVSTLALLFVTLVADATTWTAAGLVLVLTVLSFGVLLRTRGVGIGGIGRGRRQIGADARGLSVEGRVIVPRASIVRARVVESAHGSGVLIETRGLAPRVVVGVDTPRLAQALADELEGTLQAERSTISEYEALPPWAHRIRGLAMVLTAAPWILFEVARHLPGPIIGAVILGYAIVGLPLLLPQKIAIGDDGVLLKWASRRRFVPFGSIAGVHITSLGIEIELEQNLAKATYESASLPPRTIEIRLTHRADGEARRAAEICDRIRRGVDAHRALGALNDESFLARGVRPIEAWLDDVTRIGLDGAGGYRASAIPRERLWTVLENPAADPSAREGAAIALRARLGDDERERLVGIAQRSASPRLRVTVDAVSQAPTPGTDDAADSRKRVLHALLDVDLIEAEDEAPKVASVRRR